MVLTTDSKPCHFFADFLFGDNEPDTDKEVNAQMSVVPGGVGNTIVHRRRNFYSVSIFLILIAGMIAGFWGSVWKIRTSNRFVSVQPYVKKVIINDCYVVYDNFRSIAEGFGSVITAAESADKATITILGHNSRHCYIGIDIEQRSLPLVVELHKSSFLFEGSFGIAAEEALLPFDLQVTDLSDKSSDPSTAGAGLTTVNRIQFSGQYPRSLRIEQLSATVVLSLPLIRAGQNRIERPPTVDVNVGFGPVYLGASPATSTTGSYASFSAMISNGSYCIDQSTIKQFYVGSDVNPNSDLERVVGIMDTTGKLPSAVTTDVVEVALSLRCTSLYCLSDKWQNAAINGKQSQLFEGDRMASPPEISPFLKNALGLTQKWLKSLKKSSRVQTVDVVTPVGGTLVLETGIQLFLEFRIHFLNILSGFALRPARREMSTTLSHTQCLANGNSTFTTPFFEGPSSIISLYSTDANRNNPSYFRFVEPKQMFSILTQVEAYTSNGTFTSVAGYTRADYEAKPSVPAALVLRVDNTGNGFVKTEIVMSAPQFAIVFLSLTVGFVTALGVVYGLYVNSFDLIAFFYLARVRMSIRGTTKFISRCAYHLYLSLFSFLSAVSFLLTQRIYIFFKQTVLVKQFLEETFLAIPAEKRDDYKRSIPIEDLCQHYAKWLTKYFVESATFPVDELKNSIKELEGIISSSVEMMQTQIVRGVSLARANTERDVEILIPDVLVVTGKLFDEVNLVSILNECALQGLKSLDDTEALTELLAKTRGVKMEETAIEVINGLEFVRLLPDSFVKEQRGLVAAVGDTLNTFTNVANFIPTADIATDNSTSNIDLMTIQWIESSFGSFPGIDSIMAIGITAPSHKMLLDKWVFLFTCIQRAIQIVLVMGPAMCLHLVAVMFADVKGSVSALPGYLTDKELLFPFINVDFSGTSLPESITVSFFYVFLLAVFFEPVLILCFRGLNKFNYVMTEKWTRKFWTGLCVFFYGLSVFVLILYIVVVLLWWILAMVINPTEMMVFGSAAFAMFAAVSTAFNTLKHNKTAVVERLKMRVLEEMVNLMKDSSSSLADSDARNNAEENNEITAGVLIDACKGEPAALELISEHIGAPPAILTTVLAASKRDVKYIHRSSAEICELCNIPPMFKNLIAQIMMKALDMPATNGQLLRACFDLIPSKPLRKIVEELEPVISQLVQCLHEEGDQLDRMKDIIVAIVQIVLNHVQDKLPPQLSQIDFGPQTVTAMIDFINCGASMPKPQQVMGLCATLIHRIQPQIAQLIPDHEWRRKFKLLLNLFVECSRDVNGDDNDLLPVIFKFIDKCFDVQGKLNKLIYGLKNRALGFADKHINNAAAMAKSHANQSIGLAANVANQSIGMAANAASQSIGMAANAAQQGINAGANAAHQGINTGVAHANQGINIGANATSNAVGNASNSVIPGTNSVGTVLGSTVEDLGSQAVNAAQDTATGLVDQSVSQANQLVDQSVAQANQLVNQSVSQANQMVNQTVSQATRMVDQTLSQAKNQAQSTIHDAADDLTSNAVEMLVSVLKALGCPTDKIELMAEQEEEKNNIKQKEFDDADIDIDVFDDEFLLGKPPTANVGATGASSASRRGDDKKSNASVRSNRSNRSNRSVRGGGDPKKNKKTLSGSSLIQSALGLMRQSLGKQSPILRTLFKVVFECKDVSDMNKILASDPNLGKMYNALNPDGVLTSGKDITIAIDDLKHGLVKQIKKILEQVTYDNAAKYLPDNSEIKKKSRQYNFLVRWIAGGIWRLQQLWNFDSDEQDDEEEEIPEILRLSAADIDRLAGVTGIPEFVFDLFEDLGNVARSFKKFALPGTKLIHMLSVVMSSSSFSDLLPGLDPYYFPSMLKSWLPRKDPFRLQRIAEGVDPDTAEAEAALALRKSGGKESQLPPAIPEVDDEEQHPLLVSGAASASAAGIKKVSNTLKKTAAGIESAANAVNDAVGAVGNVVEEMTDMIGFAQNSGKMIALLMRLFLQKHIATDLSNLKQADRPSREKGAPIPAKDSPAAASMRGKFENDMGKLLLYQVVGAKKKLRDASGELVQRLMIEVCNFSVPKASAYEMDRFVMISQAASKILAQALKQDEDILDINATVAAHNLRMTSSQLKFFSDSRVLLKPENVITRYLFQLSRANSVLKADWHPSDEGFLLLLRRCQESGLRNDPTANPDDFAEKAASSPTGASSPGGGQQGAAGNASSPPRTSAGAVSSSSAKKLHGADYTNIAKKYNARNLTGEVVISVARAKSGAEAVAAAKKAKSGAKPFIYHSYDQDQYIAALDAILFCSFVRPHGACRKSRLYRSVVYGLNAHFFGPNIDDRYTDDDERYDCFLLYLDMIRTSMPVMWKHIVTALRLELGVPIEVLATEYTNATISFEDSVFVAIVDFLLNADVIKDTITFLDENDEELDIHTEEHSHKQTIVDDGVAKRMDMTQPLELTESYVQLCRFFPPFPDLSDPGGSVEEILHWAYANGDPFVLLQRMPDGGSGIVRGNWLVKDLLQPGTCATARAASPFDAMSPTHVEGSPIAQMESEATKFFFIAHGLEYPPALCADPTYDMSEGRKGFDAFCTFLVRRSNTPPAAMARLVQMVPLGIRRLATDMFRFRCTGFYKSIPALRQAMDDLHICDSAPDVVPIIAEILQGAVSGEDYANVFYSPDEDTDQSVIHKRPPHLVGVSAERVDFLRMKSFAKLIAQQHFLAAISCTMPRIGSSRSDAELDDREKETRTQFRSMKCVTLMQALLDEDTGDYFSSPEEYKAAVDAYETEAMISGTSSNTGGLKAFHLNEAEEGHLLRNGDPVLLLFENAERYLFRSAPTIITTSSSGDDNNAQSSSSGAAITTGSNNNNADALDVSLINNNNNNNNANATSTSRTKSSTNTNTSTSNKTMKLSQRVVANQNICACAFALVRHIWKHTADDPMKRRKLRFDVVVYGIDPLKYLFKPEQVPLVQICQGFLQRDPDMITSAMNGVTLLLQQLGEKLGIDAFSDDQTRFLLNSTITGICTIVMSRAKSDSEVSTAGADSEPQRDSHAKTISKICLNICRYFLTNPKNLPGNPMSDFDDAQQEYYAARAKIIFKHIEKMMFEGKSAKETVLDCFLAILELSASTIFKGNDHVKFLVRTINTVHQKVAAGSGLSRSDLMTMLTERAPELMKLVGMPPEIATLIANPQKLKAKMQTILKYPKGERALHIALELLQALPVIAKLASRLGVAVPGMEHLDKLQGAAGMLKNIDPKRLMELKNMSPEELAKFAMDPANLGMAGDFLGDVGLGGVGDMLNNDKLQMAAGMMGKLDAEKLAKLKNMSPAEAAKFMMDPANLGAAGDLLGSVGLGAVGDVLNNDKLQMAAGMMGKLDAEKLAKLKNMSPAEAAKFMMDPANLGAAGDLLGSVGLGGVAGVLQNSQLQAAAGALKNIDPAKLAKMSPEEIAKMALDPKNLAMVGGALGDVGLGDVGSILQNSQLQAAAGALKNIDPEKLAKMSPEEIAKMALDPKNLAMVGGALGDVGLGDVGSILQNSQLQAAAGALKNIDPEKLAKMSPEEIAKMALDPKNLAMVGGALGDVGLGDVGSILQNSQLQAAAGALKNIDPEKLAKMSPEEIAKMALDPKNLAMVGGALGDVGLGDVGSILQNSQLQAAAGALKNIDPEKLAKMSPEEIAKFALDAKNLSAVGGALGQVGLGEVGAVLQNKQLQATAKTLKALDPEKLKKMKPSEAAAALLDPNTLAAGLGAVGAATSGVGSQLAKGLAGSLKSDDLKRAAELVASGKLDVTINPLEVASSASAASALAAVGADDAAELMKNEDIQKAVAVVKSIDPAKLKELTPEQIATTLTDPKQLSTAADLLGQVGLNSVGDILKNPQLQQAAALMDPKNIEKLTKLTPEAAAAALTNPQNFSAAADALEKIGVEGPVGDLLRNPVIAQSVGMLSPEKLAKLKDMSAEDAAAALTDKDNLAAAASMMNKVGLGAAGDILKNPALAQAAGLLNPANLAQLQNLTPEQAMAALADPNKLGAAAGLLNNVGLGAAGDILKNPALAQAAGLLNPANLAQLKNMTPEQAMAALADPNKLGAAAGMLDNIGLGAAGDILKNPALAQAAGLLNPAKLAELKNMTPEQAMAALGDANNLNAAAGMLDNVGLGAAGDILKNPALAKAAKLMSPANLAKAKALMEGIQNLKAGDLMDEGNMHKAKDFLSDQLDLDIPPNIIPLVTSIFAFAKGDFTAISQILTHAGIDLSPDTRAKIMQMLRVLQRMSSDKKLGAVSLSNASEMAKDAFVEAVVDYIFKEFDKSGSGYISFNAFRSILARMRLKLPLAEVRAIFMQGDADGSGMIDRQEMSTVIFSLQEVMQREIISTIGLTNENITVAVAALASSLGVILGFVLLGVVTLGGGSEFDSVVGGAIPLVVSKAKDVGGGAGQTFERVVAGAEAAAAAVLKKMRAVL